MRPKQMPKRWEEEDSPRKRGPRRCTTPGCDLATNHLGPHSNEVVEVASPRRSRSPARRRTGNPAARTRSPSRTSPTSGAPRDVRKTPLLPRLLPLLFPKLKGERLQRALPAVRQMYEGASDIGVWLSIFSFLSVLSVITNAGVICFTSEALKGKYSDVTTEGYTSCMLACEGMVGAAQQVLC